MSPSKANSPKSAVSTLTLTPSMEDALRHIYRLAETGDGWVSNTAVATQLDVTRATVSSTFDALATRGLVEREAYRPVRLTEAGETAALDVVRRHRLVETLLVEMFDYAMSEVDVEADRLEHHLSDRLCREIERALGMPSADPHGDPIPDAALDVEHGDLIPLFDVDEAAVVEVVRILLRDDETLDELVSVGIEPSAVLTLTERTPLGTVVVTVSGTDQQTTLPEAVASAILVESGGG